jgi:hypothetical protein
VRFEIDSGARRGDSEVLLKNFFWAPLGHPDAASGDARHAFTKMRWSIPGVAFRKSDVQEVSNLRGFFEFPKRRARKRPAIKVKRWS